MKLKAAVIGVGYLGNFHAQKLKAHQDVDLVGVCDFSFEQAQKIADSLSVKAFKNAAELVSLVDYVHIAASTQSHYELASLFLRNKKAVFVEKPIAATIQQAEELCELSEKHKVSLTVGHIERFNPAFVFLKQHLQSANYLELNRLAPFRIRGSDVSVLHDLTIHDIDLVNWLFNSEISDYMISGKKLIRSTYDDVSIRLKLKNNVQVTINNSRISPQIIRNARLVNSSETININTATLEVETLGALSQDPFYQVQKQTLQKQDALALEVDHFVQHLKGNKALAITAVQATHALKQVEMFIQQLDLNN